MRKYIVILFICLMFFTSCDRADNAGRNEQSVENVQEPEVSSAAHINEFIRMRIEESKKEWERERELTIERSKNRTVDVNSVEYILENEVKDFSMYDTHPLEKYVGKWNAIDAIGNVSPDYEFIDIFISGSQYRYRRKYNREGRLLLRETGVVLLWPDGNNEYYAPFHLWEPERYDDGSLIFFATQEEPVGYFMLDEGESKFLDAWQIERIDGIWVSDYWFVNGSFFWGEPYKKWDIGGKNIRFDLEKKTLLMPDERLLIIEDIYKEGDTICLKLKTAEDDEDFFEMRITPLDYAKAYIVHDRYTEWGDSRFSPEENFVWYLLPRYIADFFNGVKESDNGNNAMESDYDGEIQ